MNGVGEIGCRAEEVEGEEAGEGAAGARGNSAVAEAVRETGEKVARRHWWRHWRVK